VRIRWADRKFCLVKFLSYFTKLFQIQYLPSRVLERLIGPQKVKKFPAFYGT